MSARTSLVLADVAWARPENLGAVVDGILGYSGPAFPGLDWIRHWGKPFLLGFESSTTRAYAGGDAGAEDARQLISVARTLPGYIENNCGAWWCSADSPNTPGWAVPGCTEYARRFVLECIGIGWRPTIGLPYGNRDASSAGVAGAIAAGIGSGMWGVGTWNFGEGGGAFQLPSDSDAVILQSGNTPGPADGTDYDALYRPLEELGFYGGPIATTPAVTTQPLEEHMELVTVPTPFGGRIARLVLGSGRVIGEWTSSGPDDEIFGTPKAAADAVPKGVPIRHINDVAVAGAFIAASDAATKGAAVTLTDDQITKLGTQIAAGVTVPAIDPAELAKDFLRELGGELASATK